MKQLYQDDENQIVIDRGLFGLTYHPLFAKIYVVEIATNQAVHVKGHERSFLMIMLNLLKKAGATPADLMESCALREFAEAVIAGPTRTSWKAFFKMQTPDEAIALDLEQLKK